MRALAIAVLALAVLAAPAGSSTRDVISVDKTWTCKGPIDVALVKVTITSKAIGSRANEDAVHLRPGCTGRIGRLEVSQWAGDGVKVAEGAHDLTIGGGSIRCFAKAPVLHQDGIQVLGGSNIVFHGLSIDCGRQQDRLVNSNLFIKQAGKSLHPPTDVVCDGCFLGGFAAHTASIQASLRSGLRNSTLCYARFPQLTLDVGADASSPVSSGNRIRACGPGLIALDPGPRTVVFSRTLQLSGIFEAQAPGSAVSLEVKPAGAARFVRAAATTTSHTGRFHFTLRPRMSERVRLSSGSASTSVSVGVRPLVSLAPSGSVLAARVTAGRSYIGRPALLEVARGSGWSVVKRIRLRRGSRGRVRLGLHAATVRLVVPAAPGYLTGTSAPVRLP